MGHAEPRGEGLAQEKPKEGRKCHSSDCRIKWGLSWECPANYDQRPWWKHCVAWGLKVSREKVNLALGLEQLMVPFCLELFKQKARFKPWANRFEGGEFSSLFVQSWMQELRWCFTILIFLLTAARASSQCISCTACQHAAFVLHWAKERAPHISTLPVLTRTAEPCFLLGQITLGI